MTSWIDVKYPRRLVREVAKGVLLLFAGLVAATGSGPASSAPPPKFLIQQARGGYRLNAVQGRIITHVQLPAHTAKELADADNAFLVGGQAFKEGNALYLLLAIIRPSTSYRGGGQCGAGTEDELALLEFRPPASTRRLDTLLVQSCLESFLLDSDQGASLEEILSQVKNPSSFDLTWEDHPRYAAGTKHILIENGRIEVH